MANEENVVPEPEEKTVCIFRLVEAVEGYVPRWMRMVPFSSSQPMRFAVLMRLDED